MTWRWQRISKELEESIDRLLNAETTRFDKLKTENLQAIAFNEPRMNENGCLIWDGLKIYNNPLALSEESYKPLNPSSAEFRTTKILTLDYIIINKNNEEEFVGFINKLLCRNPEKVHEYSIRRSQKPEGRTQVISCQKEIIPIYVGNPDFLKIMEYLEKGK